MPKPKVLFVLKRRHDYNSEKHSNINMSTGLYNSAFFMNEMLNEIGIKSEIVVVVDNNCIDKEVSKYKPTHVIIEALWVVPDKFYVLTKLHPNVKWVIRLHSEIPFLANEGSAFNWLGDYMTYRNVIIATNAPRTCNEMKFYLKHKLNCGGEILENKVVYLPNYYPQQYVDKKFDRDKEYIDICSFGAIRPLKNQLLQAIAAVKFAEKIGKKLRFHINSGRVEQKGNSVLKNIMSLFEHLYDEGHELVNHEWMPREEFLELCSKMDIGMQVSLSETFNIVGADLVSQGIPLVASHEIPWANSLFCSNPVDSEDMVKKLKFTYNFPKLNLLTNQFFLKNYTNKTKKIWKKYLLKK
jgi:hypothetical protein